MGKSIWMSNCRRFELIFIQEKTVLEQNWPEIDMDYKLELTCVVNNQECCTFKLPRREFDLLDETTSLKHLKGNEIFNKYNGGLRILSTKFEHIPGIYATLSVTTEPKKKT